MDTEMGTGRLTNTGIDSGLGTATDLAIRTDQDMETGQVAGRVEMDTAMEVDLHLRVRMFEGEEDCEFPSRVRKQRI